MNIIVCRREDIIVPDDSRWFAMRQHDYENYEPEYPAGSGASPLEAVADLLWRLDLDDDEPYSMEIRKD